MWRIPKCSNDIDFNFKFKINRIFNDYLIFMHFSVPKEKKVHILALLFSYMHTQIIAHHNIMS